jgi:LysM repeat protein
MKALPLVGTVLAVHAVVVGAVLLSQGCRTSAPATPVPEPPQTVVMPPPAIPPEPPLIKPPEAPAKTWPAKTTVYEVAKGDTLDKIARRFGLRPSEIAGLNGITNPNKIRLGQKLMLPGDIDLKAQPKSDKSKSAGSTKKTSGVTKPKTGSTGSAGVSDGNVYIVQANDSLGKIAARKGTTVAALKQANNLTSDRLQVNQKLVIPSGASKAHASVAITEPPKKSASTNLPALPAATPKVDAKAGGKSLDTEPAGGARQPDAMKPAGEDAGAAGVQRSYKTHKVEQGDDLASIAMLWAVDSSEIKKANNMTSDTVKPGDVLKIPVATP